MTAGRLFQALTGSFALVLTCTVTGAPAVPLLAQVVQSTGTVGVVRFSERELRLVPGQSRPLRAALLASDGREIGQVGHESWEVVGSAVVLDRGALRGVEWGRALVIARSDEDADTATVVVRPSGSYSYQYPDLKRRVITFQDFGAGLQARVAGCQTPFPVGGAAFALDESRFEFWCDVSPSSTRPGDKLRIELSIRLTEGGVLEGVGREDGLRTVVTGRICVDEMDVDGVKVCRGWQETTELQPFSSSGFLSFPTPRRP
jgi:hypothetical protein